MDHAHPEAATPGVTPVIASAVEGAADPAGGRATARERRPRGGDCGGCREAPACTSHVLRALCVG